MGWNNMLVDNTQYGHYAQKMANECGPSSVLMVARIFDKGLSMNDARYKVSSVDGHHRSSFQSNWTMDWSYITSLVYVLSSQGITNARMRKNLSTENYKKLVWDESSPKTPSILRVQWGHLPGNQRGFINEGGHFVVCLGRSTQDPGKVNIMDPAAAAGPVQVPAWGMHPDYSPSYGGRGHLDRNYSISTS